MVQDQHNIRFRREELDMFWDHWRQYMPPHPAADATSPHIPIGLGGDDLQYAMTGAKAMVFLVSFILHKPAAGDMARFPWCVLRHELILSAATIHPILRVCAWSLRACHIGRWPSRGPDNEPLTGKRKQKSGQPFGNGPWSVVEYRGDWKFHFDIFKLKRHYNANHLCMHCEATKSPGAHQSPGEVWIDT